VDWLSLKILFPAVVLAVLVFALFLYKGLTAARAFLAALIVGLAAYWIIGQLPVGVQEAVFSIGLAALAGLLAGRTLLGPGKSGYSRNAVWLLTIMATVLLIMAIDDWLYG
jgi:hypothetical protein